MHYNVSAPSFKLLTEVQILGIVTICPFVSKNQRTNSKFKAMNNNSTYWHHNLTQLWYKCIRTTIEVTEYWKRSLSKTLRVSHNAMSELPMLTSLSMHRLQKHGICLHHNCQLYF